MVSLWFLFVFFNILVYNYYKVGIGCDYYMKEVSKEFINEFIKQFKSIKTEGIKKQIPNMLTLSRAISPLLIIPTILLNKLNLTVIILIIFAITDFLDGRLARKYNCVSTFGVKLDAFCDKIFALGIMIPAIIRYPVLIINLLLEACISYINVLSEYKDNHPKSNIYGKIKTTFLSITLILCYIPNIDKMVILAMALITFSLQMLAFIKYREYDMKEDQKKKV